MVYQESQDIQASLNIYLSYYKELKTELLSNIHIFLPLLVLLLICLFSSSPLELLTVTKYSTLNSYYQRLYKKYKNIN